MQQLLKIFPLIGLFLIISCNKGTKENPIDTSSRNCGKLKHLKYNLYESDFQNKKTIVEKLTYFDKNDKKFHSFYTDQLNATDKNVGMAILNYSSVIDMPTYKELKGTFYALDKIHVYFLDTIKNERSTVYYADPKTFTALSSQKAKDKSHTFDKQFIAEDSPPPISTL